VSLGKKAGALLAAFGIILLSCTFGIAAFSFFRPDIIQRFGYLMPANVSEVAKLLIYGVPIALLFLMAWIGMELLRLGLRLLKGQ